MATMTLNASSYNTCQNNNYDILNENGVAVLSGGSWKATKTDKSFKIRAKDNYSFNPLNNETPLVNFSDFRIYVSGIGTWYCTDYTLTYNDDYTEITVNLVSGDMYDNWGGWNAQLRVSNNVKATPKKVLQNFTITENLTGCTSNNTDTTITEGTTKTITYDSETGKEFVAELCSCNTGSFDIIGKYFASWTVENVDKDVVITMVANVPTVYYDVETNLTNVSADENNPVKVEENTDFTLIYHANNGYKINTITCNIGTVVISDDKLTATITGVATENISVVATGKKIHYVYITGELNNCTCNYENGEEITDDKPEIILTVNNGYEFNGVYKYKRGVNTQTFSVSDDKKTLSTSISDGYNYELNDDYKATKEIEQVGTFVNLYKTNQTELTKLSKVRFYESMGQVTDYGSYISSLYILPFDIPNDILGDKSTILLGNLDSNVESTLISTYSFDIDGGEIEVPLKYNNIYDFVNTECILHLPFLNKIYLNSEYVIGQTLSIIFTIELYSGNLTVNIKSSFNNEIVASVQGLIGMNIPFIQKSNGNVINKVSNVYKNRNNRCFIEVNRNIPYTKNNNVFGGSVVEYGKIGDYQGYLECDKIVLETKATNQEQEEIKNILRNGVFI